MTLWKTGALAGALFVAAAAGAAWTPIVHGKGEEPQRWEHDSDSLQDLRAGRRTVGADWRQRS